MTEAAQNKNAVPVSGIVDNRHRLQVGPFRVIRLEHGVNLAVTAARAARVHILDDAPAERHALKADIQRD